MDMCFFTLLLTKTARNSFKASGIMNGKTQIDRIFRKPQSVPAAWYTALNHRVPMR